MHKSARANGTTDRNDNKMPSNVIRGGNSVETHGQTTTSNDNWRKRSNAKPLVINRH